MMGAKCISHLHADLSNRDKQKGLEAHVLALTCTRDARGPHTFQSMAGKMDGLRGLCNLLGGRAPMQFASQVCMFGWRHL
jgi:hypothetical protein